MDDPQNALRAAAPRQNGAGKLDEVRSALTPTGRAHTVSDGVSHAALLIEALRPGPLDTNRAEAARKAIEARAERVRAGDLAGLERDLAAQGAILDALIEWALARGTAPGLKPAAAAQWLAVALRAAGVKVRTAGALAGLVLAQGRVLDGDAA